MESLTIATGLRRVAKLKGKIAEYTARATDGVSYIKGEEPAFRFEEQMELRAAAIEEMVDIQTRIAIANAKVVFTIDSEDAKGKTVTKEVTLALATRIAQEHKSLISLLKSLMIQDKTILSKETIYVPEKGIHTYVDKTTVWVTDLDEKTRDVRVQELSDRLEKLNNLINQANFTTVI